MLTNTGIPTGDDIKPITPTDERFSQGPVVIVECFQEIPCNPCVDACKLGAITKPNSINDLPIIDFDKCNGCGICIKQCPGLAIFVVDKTYSETHAIVRIPHEFVPVPEKGQMVCGLDRAGDERGMFEVARVISGGTVNKTTVIWLIVPQELAMEIRAVKPGVENSEFGIRNSEFLSKESNDIIVCRCEDVTLGDIRRVIQEGYNTIDDIKRVTRAGMGPCQGRTCRMLIAAELSRHYKIPMEEVIMPTFRPPIKPVKLGAFSSNS